MNEQKTKKIFNYMLIGIGALSIIFAILCFVLNGRFANGLRVSDQYYGGDAYTGIQNAAAATANQVYRLNNNIETLANCIKIGFGFILLIAGLIIILYGIQRLLKNKNNKQELMQTNIE